MITIKRDSFDLLEHLREIYQGSTIFSRNLCQCPASGKIAGQQYFNSIGQAAAAMRRTNRVRCGALSWERLG
jgi:hypothetical protein